MTAASGRDDSAALACAIRVHIVNFMTFAGMLRVDPIDRVDWASITFTGARHRLRIRFEGEGAVGMAADFLAAMGDLDLPVPGHILADLALLAEERASDGSYALLDVEALTVEDR